MRKQYLNFISGRFLGTNMDNVKKLLPTIGKILDKKKYAINISTIDNEVIFSVIDKKRVRRFKHTDSVTLIANINRHFHFA